MTNQEQQWVHVSRYAPDFVHDAVVKLFCEILDAGIGAVLETDADGPTVIFWSEESQQYNDEREMSEDEDEDEEATKQLHIFSQIIASQENAA